MIGTKAEDIAAHARELRRQLDEEVAALEVVRAQAVKDREALIARNCKTPKLPRRKRRTMLRKARKR